MNTRLYEGTFLFDSNLASRDWPGLERHVEELMKRNSARLEYTERWPDRKLMHEIKGCKKGTYYVTYFNAPPESISSLERDVRLSDRILRLMVVREEGMDEILERARARLAERAARGETDDFESSSDDDDRPSRGRRPERSRVDDEESEDDADGDSGDSDD